MDSELWFSRGEGGLWSAVVEDRRIVEIHPPAPSVGASYGAIYLARVQRVVPHLDAAFVQLAPGLEGYLEAPANEVRRLGSGQALVVQVRREAHGTKRARVSDNPEYAGSRMSLRPRSSGVAISRRLTDPAERRRLESWARAAGAGRLVLRTAASAVSEAVLGAERETLAARAATVAELARESTPPSLLEAAPSPIERLVRDFAGRGLRRVLVETDADEAAAVTVAGPGVAVDRWPGPEPMLRGSGVLEAARRATDPRVELDGGGSLTIEATRALWAVDVDSGPARVPAGALNREAAKRVAAEIRLRDMAGTILVDFLAMNGEERAVTEAVFREALRADRRYLRLTGWTPLGLCELARRREGPSLAERLRSAGLGRRA